MLLPATKKRRTFVTKNTRHIRATRRNEAHGSMKRQRPEHRQCPVTEQYATMPAATDDKRE